MKKILVTGATGFVGYHVAKKCVERNLGEIFCLCRPNSQKRFLQELPLKLIEGDLKDKSSLEKALDGCEILFHVAADYRLWARNSNELIETNVKGTENILEAAEKYKVKKIVYTSSVSAVGRPETAFTLGWEKLDYASRVSWEKKYEGNETLDPTSHQLIGPYKKSKYFAELVARKFAQKGMPLVIVNPSTPIGSHDIKPTPTGKLILDFLNRQMPAYLETGLNLVDVQDVAEAHLLAALKGKIGERYILGNKNLMLKEIFQILEEITGIPSPSLRIPYWVAYSAGFLSTAFAQISGNPPKVPLDGVKMAKEIMFYDSSKATRELGMAQNDIRKSLEESVKFFNDHGYVKR